MVFQITSSKLTGTPDESGWSQVHEFRPGDEEKLKVRGVLFAVISTKKTSEGIDGVVFGREIISRLHEEYYGKLGTSSFYALKAAVEGVSKEFGGEREKIEIAAVSIVSDVIYSAACGGAKVMIYRTGALAEILDSKEKVVSASGYPKEGDVLICASSLFFKSISLGSIKASVSGKDVGHAAEQLAPSVHASNVQGRLGIVFVRFTKTVDDKTPMFAKQKPFREELADKKKTREKFKLSALFSGVLKKLPKNSSKRIYVRSQTENLEEVQSKKTAFTVGFVILILLVVSIVFGVRQKTENERRKEYESVFLTAKHEFEEANEIFSLNPQRARDLFLQSKQKVFGLVSEDNDDEETNSLWDAIQQSEGVILGEYNLEPKLFIDLTLQSDDFYGTDVSVSNETLFVLDKDAEKALSVVIESKKTQILAGPSLIDDAKYIASYSDRAFILSGDSVFEIGDEKRDLIEKDWEGDVMPYAYTGNFYLLDKGESEIYRYSGVGLDFSSRNSWLDELVEVDFGDVISWTIDGNIWTLTETGEILRFSMGNRVNFSAKGLSPPLTNPKQIFTHEELDYLYILDPENSRVVVLDKEGEFKAQYVSGKIKEAVDFGISEEHKKIIILIPGKLMEIELRHQ
jgi:hypothetical protein